MGETRLPLREDYLSYKDTVALRFLFLIAIFVFHGAYEYPYQFPNIGYTCVAGFFFLSGYGLEYSVRNKKGYLGNFLQKRVFGILIQYWVIEAVYAAILLILYFNPQLSYDTVTNALFRNPVWFITELLVFYVVFFFASMFGSDRGKILFMLIASSVLMLLMTDYYGTNLYLKSGMGFVFGVVWAMYRERIDVFLRVHFIPLMIASLLILCLTFRINVNALDMMACGITSVFSMVLLCMACMVDARKAWYVPLLLIIVGLLMTTILFDMGRHSEGAFMILFAGISTVCYCFPSVQSVLSFWGGMSFEFYIMHFVPLNWVYPNITSSVPLAFAVSFILALVFTYIAWRAVRIVLGLYNKGLVGLSEKRPDSMN